MSDDRSTSRVAVLATADGPAPVGQTGSGEPNVADREMQSPAMRALFEEAGHAAPSDSTILITGETGVGKEWLAFWLQAHPRRGAGSLAAVHCAGVPDATLA